MSKIHSSLSGLAYRRVGKGHALLLLHGIPGSGATWLQSAQILSSDLDVIIPDLIGFGRSQRNLEPSTFQAGAQAKALLDLLDELEIKSVAVAGYDFGGPVALLLHRLQSPLISHLALFATNAFMDTPIPFPLSMINWPGAASLLAPVLFSRAALAAMLQMGMGTPRIKLDRAHYLGDAAQVRTIREIFASSLTSMEKIYEPVQAELSHVKVPCLVGWGNRDPFFPLDQGRRTAKALGGSLKVYDNAGHFLPAERPRELARDLFQLILGSQDDPRSAAQAGAPMSAISR